MIHGPCGSVNPDCVCMENGTCTKQFPKNFQSETQLNDSGYPAYARPDNGISFTNNQKLIVIFNLINNSHT